jgi:hypothetical protein
VSGEASNDPHYYSINGGPETWVGKSTNEIGDEGLLAEAVCWLLAKALGVPTPDALCGVAQDERVWLCAFQTGTHWQPTTLSQLRQMDELGRILAFDALVMNEDRHAGNFVGRCGRRGPQRPESLRY